MTLADLLQALGARGVELAPGDGGRVRFRPADIPAALAMGIRDHKPALLDLLGRGADPLPGADDGARYVLGERLGMADGLGLPTHPGAPAWSVAVGESMDCSCTKRTNGVE